MNDKTQWTPIGPQGDPRAPVATRVEHCGKRVVTLGAPRWDPHTTWREAGGSPAGTIPWALELVVRQILCRVFFRAPSAP